MCTILILVQALGGPYQKRLQQSHTTSEKTGTPLQQRRTKSMGVSHPLSLYNQSMSSDAARGRNNARGFLRGPCTQPSDNRNDQDVPHPLMSISVDQTVTSLLEKGKWVDVTWRYVEPFRA